MVVGDILIVSVDVVLLIERINLIVKHDVAVHHLLNQKVRVIQPLKTLVYLILAHFLTVDEL